MVFWQKVLLLFFELQIWQPTHLWNNPIYHHMHLLWNHDLLIILLFWYRDMTSLNAFYSLRYSYRVLEKQELVVILFSSILTFSFPFGLIMRDFYIPNHLWLLKQQLFLKLCHHQQILLLLLLLQVHLHYLACDHNLIQ